MGFDLTDLNLFLHVAEAGSITAGAARAHLSLASASARILALEDSLGAQLFTRARRGVEPTAAGRELIRHARAVTSQVERLRAELGRFAGGLRGSVRLWCNTAALTEHLPAPLGSFLARHPEVDVELRERPSREIAQALRRGEADIGVLTDAAAPPGFEAAPFRADRIVLVAGAGHPLAGRRSVSFAAALDHPFVCLSEDSALQKHLEHHAAQAGKRFRCRVRVRTFEAVCLLAGMNAGIGAVPLTAALRSPEAANIRRIILSDEFASRRLAVCARSFEALTAHARSLAEALMA